MECFILKEYILFYNVGRQKDAILTVEIISNLKENQNGVLYTHIAIKCIMECFELA